MTKKLFYYQGSNALNQKQKGSIIADTKQQAHFQLISRGLTHIKLQQNWQFGAKLCSMNGLNDCFNPLNLV